MHTQSIVAQVMQSCSPLMHAARRRALSDAVVSAVNGRSLSLVGLALGVPRPTRVRHRDKCVDRLLGSRHLQACRLDLYAALAHRWLAGLPQLLIVIDWSSVSQDMQWHGKKGSDTHAASLSPASARFPWISTRATVHGTVSNGSGFGRRFSARGSIRPDDSAA